MATRGASVSRPGWRIESARERTSAGEAGSRRLTSARLWGWVGPWCRGGLLGAGLVGGTSVPPRAVAGVRHGGS